MTTKFMVKILDRNGSMRERVVDAESEADARAVASARFNLARNGTIEDVEPTSRPVSAYLK